MSNNASIELRKSQAVDTSLPVCGNCVCYEWAPAGDSHHGSCVFQDGEDNTTVSQYFVRYNLHALTGVEMCSCFKRLRSLPAEGTVLRISKPSFPLVITKRDSKGATVPLLRTVGADKALYGYDAGGGWAMELTYNTSGEMVSSLPGVPHLDNQIWIPYFEDLDND